MVYLLGFHSAWRRVLVWVCQMECLSEFHSAYLLG